jgi:hypothetical protein
MEYQVKQGDSIVDIALNSSGGAANWADLLEKNNHTTWTPILNIETPVNIDVKALQPIFKRELTTYPASNSSVNDILMKISQEISKFGGDNWILATGSWNDSGIWIDTAIWTD